MAFKTHPNVHDRAAEKLMMVYSHLHGMIASSGNQDWKLFGQTFEDGEKSFVLAMYQANVMNMYSISYFEWTADRMRRANAIWAKARKYYNKDIVIRELFYTVGESGEYNPDEA